MANATIINNELSSAVSGLRVDNPYMYIPYPDKPKPVSGGGLFFGIPGTDPELPQNQKRVYYIQEDGSILPLAQPVILGAGGVPTYNGTPAKLAVDGSYSFKVIDKIGTAAQSTIYYSPKTTHPALQQIGESQIIEEIITLEDGQTVVEFEKADISQSVVDVNGLSTDSRNLIKDDDYTIGDGASGIMYLTRSYPAGTKIRARQNAFSNQEERSVAAFPYAYDTLAEAIAEDLPVGTKVVICGESDFGDSLTFPLYRVVEGGTGTADNVLFINMANGNQLQSLSVRNNFSTFNEQSNTETISGGTLTIDVNNGTVQTVTLTENISSILFANVVDGKSTTVTMRFVQDATGGRTINFAGLRCSGGVGPTITPAPDAHDIVVFTTWDNTRWYAFQAAENASIV